MITAYIFISAAQRDLLAPVGLPADRSFVKHNFVPAPPPHPEIATKPQVAYVGRLDEAKGAPFLMRAWDAFRARRPSLAAAPRCGRRGRHVGGRGPLGDRHPSVTVAGHVSRPEVFRILARSRAVVVPSQWEETFGMVAVEAMAAGTAAVASAHGAFPELVTHGSDGALFPPTDVDALVDILADIDDHPQRWDDLRPARTPDVPKPFQPGCRRRPAAGDLPLRDGASAGAVRTLGEYAPIGSLSRRGGDGDHALRKNTISADRIRVGPELIQAVRRLGWGVADQGISSLSNFALGLFVARSFGATASERSRSPSSPTRWSSTPHAAWRPIRSSSATAAIWFVAGAAPHRPLAGPPSLSAWALVSSASSPGCSCPIRWVRYSSRLASDYLGLPCRTAGGSLSSRCGRGASAFINDLVWTVLLVLALVVMHGRADSAAHCMLAFGGTATLAALLGMLQARTLASPLTRCGLASHAPRFVGSIPRRERQQQWRIAGAFLRAGCGRRPRRRRLRPSF